MRDAVSRETTTVGVSCKVKNKSGIQYYLKYEECFKST